MEYIITFENGSLGYLGHSALSPDEIDKRHYAFPEQRKFPMPDREHVLSAIRFFNYVDPKDEKHLAEYILKRMDELGIDEVNVGEGNRFKKYYDDELKHFGIKEKGEVMPDYLITFDNGSNGYLSHHGVKGMHWGVRNAETQARYASEGTGKHGNSSERKGLSEGQKRALKTAAVGIGVAAVVGGGVLLARHHASGKMIAQQMMKRKTLDQNWANDQKRLRAGAKATRDAFYRNTHANHPTWKKGALRSELNYARKESKNTYRSYNAYKWQKAHAKRAGTSSRFDSTVGRDNKNLYSYGRRMNQHIKAYSGKRKAYKKAVDNLNRQTVSKQRKINVASGIGGATALGAGAGVAYAYNKKKSSEKK